MLNKPSASSHLRNKLKLVWAFVLFPHATVHLEDEELYELTDELVTLVASALGWDWIAFLSKEPGVRLLKHCVDIPSVKSRPSRQDETSDETEDKARPAYTLNVDDHRLLWKLLGQPNPQ